MKVTVISDTHNQHRRIDMSAHDHGEMIIHCGDWMTRDISHHNFMDWFGKLEYKYKILVAGNHDYLVEEMGYTEFKQGCEALGIIYLQDTSVSIMGIKFHGTPWTPQFGHYSFMADDFELDKYWQKIPLDVNVLISHGPRHGSGDKVYMTYDNEGPNVGSRTLRYRMKDFTNLDYHFCGHIHEDYGIDEECKDYVSCNASSYDYYVDGVRHPFTFDLSDLVK